MNKIKENYIFYYTSKSKLKESSKKIMKSKIAVILAGGKGTKAESYD